MKNSILKKSRAWLLRKSNPTFKSYLKILPIYLRSTFYAYVINQPVHMRRWTVYWFLGFHLLWWSPSCFAEQADSEPLRIYSSLWLLQLPPGIKYFVTSSWLTDFSRSLTPAFCSTGSTLRFSTWDGSLRVDSWGQEPLSSSFPTCLRIDEGLLFCWPMNVSWTKSGYISGCVSDRVTLTPPSAAESSSDSPDSLLYASFPSGCAWCPDRHSVRRLLRISFLMWTYFGSCPVQHLSIQSIMFI